MQAEVPSYESLAPGISFAGRYQLIRTLGQGGFAKVFLADDQTLEIPVALKVLNPQLSRDDRQLRRFKREVIVTRTITHKNVCKIYDIGQIGDLAYLTMEYIDGQELYMLLLKRRAFPIKIGLNLCYQIASALDAAHREGVVHRDLKPHNIIIDRRGTAKILDFGIARFLDTTGVTDSGTMMGTPNYMSPEQCRGEQGDARSDLYSFGVLMYQIFTGTRPFAADTPLGVLYLHLHTAPKPPNEVKPNLPQALNDLILKCLAKAPEHRYQSARSLLRDVQALFRQSAGGPVSYPREDTPPGSASTNLLMSGTPSGMLSSMRPEPTPRGAPGPEHTVPTLSSEISQEEEMAELDDIEPELPEISAPRSSSTPAAPGISPSQSAAQKPSPTPAAPAPGLLQPLPPPEAQPEPLLDEPTQEAEAAPFPRNEAEEPDDSFDSDETAEAAGPPRGLVLALAGIAVALVGTLAAFGPELLRELQRGSSPPVATATPVEEISLVPAIFQPSPTASPVRLAAAAPTSVSSLASAPGTPAVFAGDPNQARVALSSALSVLLPPTPLAAPTPLPFAPPSPTPTSEVAAPPTVPPPLPTSTLPPSPTPPVPTPTVPPPLPTSTLPPSPTPPVPTPTAPPPTRTPIPPTQTQPPTAVPKLTPTPKLSPTPRPTRQRPPTPTVPATSSDLLLGGVPDGTTVCIDSRIWASSKQGFSFILKGVSAGPHRLTFVSRQKGSAEKSVQVQGSGTPPLKLAEADWKPPHYRVSLKTNAERMDLDKPVNVKEKIQLQAGKETITVELKLAATELWIQRADGRELKKLCGWPDTAVCGTLPPLNCGTIPLQ